MLANLSETMQQTMFLMLFVVLSFILLSGLMTPVESMPMWAQKLTRCLPPTYMVEIMRSVLTPVYWTENILSKEEQKDLDSGKKGVYRHKA